MLGIISAAGNALRSFGSIHPAIKWGVVAIVGLLAVAYVTNEGIGVYRALQVEQINSSCNCSVDRSTITACEHSGGTWDFRAHTCKTN